MSLGAGLRVTPWPNQLTSLAISPRTAAACDDLVGPARKEILDHAAAARQQAMGVAALRHALARDVGEPETHRAPAP